MPKTANPEPRPSEGNFTTIVGIVVIAVVALLFYLRTRTDDVPEEPGAEAVVEAPPEGTPRESTPPTTAAVSIDLFPESTTPVAYVGPDACRECHEDRCEEFASTKHFRTSRPVKASEMLARLQPGRNRYESRDPGVAFEMTARGDEVLQTAITADDSGGERRVEQVAAILYGAGEVDEIYHYWRDDELFQLPIAYLHPLESWANAPGYMDGTVELNRPTTPRCLECHATYFEHRPGTRNAYNTTNFILGITCERCHGPGREHVEFHRANPDEITAHHITQPADLTRQQQLEVCGQCHGKANRLRRPAFTFEPGEAIEEHYRFDLNTHAEKNHTSDQIGALQSSRCYTETESLTCSTCHDPHTGDNKDFVVANQRSCASCHEPAACGKREALPEAIRDQCIDCHMPARRVMNIRFDTAKDEYVPLIVRRDHRIAIHDIATKDTLLTWAREQDDNANKELTEQLAKELFETHVTTAQEMLDQHRYVAAIGSYREALRITPSDDIEAKLAAVQTRQRELDLKMRGGLEALSQQRFPQAMAIFEEVLAVNPRHATAHGRLGMLLANSGQIDAGREHLEAVARHDPDSAYGHGLLGWISYLDKDYDEALENYAQAIELQPYNAKINYNMALAHAGKRNFDAARAHLETVLSIEPTHIDALHRLLSLLQSQGNTTDAITIAHNAARASQQRDPQVLMLLAEAYFAAGRAKEAIAAGQLALQATSDATSLTQIRQRLDFYRHRSR